MYFPFCTSSDPIHVSVGWNIIKNELKCKKKAEISLTYSIFSHKHPWHKIFHSSVIYSSADKRILHHFYFKTCILQKLHTCPGSIFLQSIWWYYLYHNDHIGIRKHVSICKANTSWDEIMLEFFFKSNTWISLKNVYQSTVWKK